MYMKKLTKRQLTSIKGGTQDVGDIDRTQPNKIQQSPYS